MQCWVLLYKRPSGWGVKRGSPCTKLPVQDSGLKPEYQKRNIKIRKNSLLWPERGTEAALAGVIRRRREATVCLRIQRQLVWTVFSCGAVSTHCLLFLTGFVCLILRQGLAELSSLALNFFLSLSCKWSYRPASPGSAQQHIFRHCFWDGSAAQ